VIAEAEYDLVVLAVGVLPNRDATRLFNIGELALDGYDYVEETDEDANLARTSIPGVFVAGAASAPRDILHAGGAVAQAAAHLARAHDRRDDPSGARDRRRRGRHARGDRPG